MNPSPENSHLLGYSHAQENRIFAVGNIKRTDYGTFEQIFQQRQKAGGHAHLQAGRNQAPPDECRLPRPQHHGERGEAVAVRDGEEMINCFGFLFELFDYL